MNYGLVFASITTSIVLFNTTPVWIYAISLSTLVPLTLREKFSIIKALMIFLIVLGFSVISYSDFKNEGTSDIQKRSNAIGNSSCLLSAICYGFYSTYLKVNIPEEREATFQF